MYPVSLAQIAEVTGGRLSQVPDLAVTVTGRAVIDSRQARAGDLFCAFDGAAVDGHAFAETAVRAGAAAVLASRDVPVPSIVVPDVTAALARLAGWSARQMTGTRIGITGSSGKTSAKDLLGQVLPGDGTLVTEGSQNNELGVPLTVLRADEATRYLVLEMGARGVGHIAYLCDIALPKIAVVLNVGRAHSGEFGSLDATAAAKGELPAAVPSDGFAVLNADDARVAGMAARTRGTVVTFGLGPDADVRATDVSPDGLGRPCFTLRIAGSEAKVRLRLLGTHHVYNALAAAAVAHALGMSLDDIAARLSDAVAVTGGRMQLMERPDGVAVIDDAYNANPDSMNASLEALAAMRAGGRRIAVIGEMKELGASSPAEHRAVGEVAGKLGIDLVVAVGGDDAAQVAAGAQDAGADARLVPGREAARELLEGHRLGTGDVVLVKASLAAGLRALAADLAGRVSADGH